MKARTLPLPRAAIAGLTSGQRHGRRCVSCLKRVRQSARPVAISEEGSVLMACDECEPRLVRVTPGN